MHSTHLEWLWPLIFYLELHYYYHPPPHHYFQIGFLFDYHLITFSLDIPEVPAAPIAAPVPIVAPPPIAAPAPVAAPVPACNLAAQPVNHTSSLRRRPARTPGLVGTNASFLVPESIRKKFDEGWVSHVPLTYLTDKGCLLKNKSMATALQDVLSFDSTTGQVVTTSKVLQDSGELELTFDEWDQAWRRLLVLIKDHSPQELHLWEAHHSFIINSENRSELWPLYLAYDAEIRRRATQTSIDPSRFSMGIWNDLEIRYSHKKVLSLIQADLKQQTERLSLHYPTNPPSYTPRNHTQQPFRPPPTQHLLPDNPKIGRCIFCGDRSKSHPPRSCVATCFSNGTPCHLTRQEPSGARTSKTGKRYCYAWNGPSGCEQHPCRRGEHLCTLCGSTGHNAQQCDATP